MKRRTLKRMLSMTLAASVMLGMLSVGVFAEDETDELLDASILNMETEDGDYTEIPMEDDLGEAGLMALAETDPAEGNGIKPLAEGHHNIYLRTDDPTTDVEMLYGAHTEMSVAPNSEIATAELEVQAAEKNAHIPYPGSQITTSQTNVFYVVRYPGNGGVMYLTDTGSWSYDISDACKWSYHDGGDKGICHEGDKSTYLYMDNKGNWQVGKNTGANKQKVFVGEDGHITYGSSDLGFAVTIDTLYQTQITFTGVTPGVTNVKVGNYDFTVYVTDPTHEYVVDFGLPVEIPAADLIPTNDWSIAVTEQGENCSAEMLDNGNVQVTMTGVLTGEETIKLEVAHENHVEDDHTITIIPATTVYYEEGFASYSDDWSDKGNMGNGTQTTSAVKEEMAAEAAVYGYDAAYVNGTNAKTSAKSNAAGDTATFAFYGTGVEVYADTNTSSGAMLIQLFKAEDNSLQKTLLVNTVMQAGKITGSTDFQAVSANNVPVATLTGYTPDHYYVKITHVNSPDKTCKPVAIDGFRVFGTMAAENENSFVSEDEDAYIYDLEDNPEYIELRDAVLSVIEGQAPQDEGTQTHEFYNSEVQNIDACGAIIYGNLSDDDEDPYKEIRGSEAYLDLLNNGPKNEIYLVDDYSVHFAMATDRTVEVGLKALNGTVAALIDGEEVTVSDTDMFYLLQNAGAEEKTHTISLAKGETGILSVTLLKVCDAVDTVFAPVSQIDTNKALLDLGLIDLNSAPEITEEPEIEEPVDENPFEDVIEGKYYYTPVLWAVNVHITNGKDATHFAPNDTCTRAQAVTFLWRALGEPEPEATTCDFVDVKAGSYYYKAVLWAVENGITKGIDATHFAPNAECTRAQIVTFLYRAVAEEEVTATECGFEDVKAGAYYYEAVLWAVELGITNGKDATHFAPADACTRGQIVTFLYRT